MPFSLPAPASLQGIGAAPRIVGGVGAVDRARVLPQAGRDEFGLQPMGRQLPAHGRGGARDLGRRHFVEARHDIIVVELDAVEAQPLVKRQFFIEGDRFADRRPERIGALVNVPRSEQKTEFTCHGPDPPPVIFDFPATDQSSSPTELNFQCIKLSKIAAGFQPNYPRVARRAPGKLRQ